jgi:hypothetical protein
VEEGGDDMDADTTRTRAMLVGVWAVQAGGIQSQLSLSEDGTYINLLAGGMQSHWGKWSVVANMLHFVLDGAAPQTWTGPLGAVQIQWPKSESWGLVRVADDLVQITGGTMVRSQPRPHAPVGPGGADSGRSTTVWENFTIADEGPPPSRQAALDEFMKQ